MEKIEAFNILVSVCNQFRATPAEHEKIRLALHILQPKNETAKSAITEEKTDGVKKANE